MKLKNREGVYQQSVALENTQHLIHVIKGHFGLFKGKLPHEIGVFNSANFLHKLFWALIIEPLFKSGGQVAFHIILGILLVHDARKLFFIQINAVKILKADLEYPNDKSISIDAELHLLLMCVRNYSQHCV